MTKHPLLEFFLVTALLGQIIPIISAADTDIGMIAYFNGPCPEGWGDYIEAQGVFIFSAGNGYNVGSKGGEFEHTLKDEEMPGHSHHMFGHGARTYLTTDTYCRGSTAVSLGGIGNENFEYDIQGISDIPKLGKSEIVGGGNPHNNMPPYITLRACQKLREIKTDLSQYVKIDNLNLSLAGYIKASDIFDYVKRIDLNQYALKSEIPSLTGYIKASDLSEYIKGSDLQTYAKDLQIGALKGYARTQDLVELASKNDLNSHITDFEMEKMKLGQVQDKIDALTFDELEKQILEINSFTSDLQQKYNLLQQKYQDLFRKFNQLDDTYANLQDKLKKLNP